MVEIQVLQGMADCMRVHGRGIRRRDVMRMNLVGTMMMSVNSAQLLKVGNR